MGQEFGETNFASAVAIQHCCLSVLPVALPGIGIASVNPKAPVSLSSVRGGFCRVAVAVDLCHLATCSVNGKSLAGPQIDD